MGELKEISIEITNKCNLRCIHCSSEAGDRFKKELSLDEIVDILNQTKSLGGKILTLSGGEPILRADLFEIIRSARKKDFEIRLQTSGAYNLGDGFVSIPKHYLEAFLENMGPEDKIVYGVLGLQQTHEHITSVGGSFELVMKSIRRTKDRGINVEVHTVSNGLNYLEMFQLAEILNAERVDSWHLLRLVPQGRCTEHPELELSQEQFRELQESILTLSKRDFGIKLKLGHNIDRRHLSDESYSAIQCQIGEDKMLIRANGDVTYCAALKYERFGNIRDNPLSYFWEDHPFVKEVRTFLSSGFLEIVGKCSSCDILADCKCGCVAQRLYHDEELKRGPDPLCYRKPTKK